MRKYPITIFYHEPRRIGAPVIDPWWRRLWRWVTHQSASAATIPVERYTFSADNLLASIEEQLLYWGRRNITPRTVIMSPSVFANLCNEKRFNQEFRAFNGIEEIHGLSLFIVPWIECDSPIVTP